MAFFILDSHFVTYWWPLDSVLKRHFPTNKHWCSLYNVGALSIQADYLSLNYEIIRGWTVYPVVKERDLCVGLELEIQFVSLRCKYRNIDPVSAWASFAKWIAEVNVFSTSPISPLHIAGADGDGRHLSWFMREPGRWRSRRLNQQ